MALKLNQPIDFHLSKRYYRFNRSHAIRDVFDALVELITNSDDSYHRLHRKGLIERDGGWILIEHCEQRGSRRSCIRVHDRAEGLTLQEMHRKLADVGTRQSEAGDRGFMSRGLKDCTALGDVTVESIRDDRYAKCQLTGASQFVPLENREVTADLRKQLRILRGNGTVVSLQIGEQYKLPRIERIATDLPWHYSLRDVIASSSASGLLPKSCSSR